MRERAIQFGSHRGLVGIVTTPDGQTSSDAARPKRAIVMANVGLHHRVGPYRLYVDIARRAAANGLVALRFDLSGLGDSAARPGGMSDRERALIDMAEGMAWLEAKLGIKEFVVIGLCSGVDVAHPIAVQDPRVVGGIFIDGYTYSTAESRVRRRKRFFQLQRWTRFIARKRAERARGWVTQPPADQQLFVRDYPEQSAFRTDVSSMVQRGARLLFIWTGTYSQYNHEHQLYEMLGGVIPRGSVDVEYMTDADHVFTAIQHRERLLDRITGWMASSRDEAH
ncbi:MAG TPA: alpha/beta fold hydrolase [Gemmatimonadaceae bacterium]